MTSYVTLKAVIGLSLVVCTTGEVLYYSHTSPAPSLDEVRGSVSTVEFVLSNKRPVLFQYGSSYMAPLLEMIVAPVCALTHSTPLSITRVSAAISLGISALLLFETLALELTLILSSVVAVAYGLATPWLLFWKLKMAGYPAGLLCCFGFLYIFFKFRPATFLLGVLAGLLHYIFPISIAFIITAFLSRVDLREISSSIRGRVRLNRLSGILSAGALTALVVVGAAAAYANLTDRLQGPAAAAVLAAFLSVALATGFGLLIFSHRNQPFDLQFGRRIAAPPAIFLLGFLLIEIPEKLIFYFIETPYFSSRGVTLWSGNDYSLKQWTAWPTQVVVYLDRILSQALIPIQSQAWIPYYQGALHPSLAIVPGLLSVAAILFAARQSYLGHLQSSRSLAPEVSYLSRPSGHFLASFIIISLVLVPSWRLFGDPSVRYLTPYFPAIYIALVVIIRDLADIRSRSRQNR